MENVILSLANIIAKQEREIEGLKQTIASTVQVAIEAEQRCGSTCTALDTACARIAALRSGGGQPSYYELAVAHALAIIEDLGGMDPAKREAAA